MSYTADDIMDRLDWIASALDRMGARQTQLEHKFLELYDLVLSSRSAAPPQAMPVCYHCFPAQMPPNVSGVSWSVTYQPPYDTMGHGPAPGMGSGST